MLVRDDRTGLVAALAQPLGERRELAGQGLGARPQARGLVLGRQHAGEQAGVARQGEGARRARLAEDRRLLAHPEVELGSRDPGVAVGRQALRAHRVEHDQEQVRRLSRARRRGRQVVAPVGDARRGQPVLGRQQGGDEHHGSRRHAAMAQARPAEQEHRGGSPGGDLPERRHLVEQAVAALDQGHGGGSQDTEASRRARCRPAEALRSASQEPGQGPAHEGLALEEHDQRRRLVRSEAEHRTDHLEGLVGQQEGHQAGGEVERPEQRPAPGQRSEQRAHRERHERARDECLEHARLTRGEVAHEVVEQPAAGDAGTEPGSLCKTPARSGGVAGGHQTSTRWRSSSWSRPSESRRT